MKGAGALFSRRSDEWMTPPELYHALDSVYHFTLDPCTTPENPLNAPKFYTAEDDGLSKSWMGETVYMNPPYSDVSRWVRKARDECRESFTRETTVACLLPARTDTRWFHDCVKDAVQVAFIKRRVRFVGGSSSAPFPSMIVVFHGSPAMFLMDGVQPAMRFLELDR